MMSDNAVEGLPVNVIEARVRFVAADVQSWAEATYEEPTEAQAEAWLKRNYKHIEETMLLAGWDAIETLDGMDPIGVNSK